MSDLEKDLIASVEQFHQKLKRGDLIPTSRAAWCHCGGDPDCRRCKGIGAVFTRGYLNDWEGSKP